MEVKSKVSIHNKFDIIVRDAKTEKIIQRGQAENIVLDRMYTRLLNFQTYFTNIVFGKGEGIPSESRDTLFDRIGYKSAETEELTRDYPTSTWTRKIRLGTDEFNGNVITEVGISDTTTNINTHAMITDSEGEPISVSKSELVIIDLYATVYIDLYDVDSGLFFYDDGLRDYLTGGSSPNNNLRISYLSEDDSATISGTKTTNLAEKTISVAARFNVGDHNKDVKYIDWVGLGIRCALPRVGVFESLVKHNVTIGTGDGVETKFKIPNNFVKNISIKIDNTASTDWTFDVVENEIVFNTAPGVGLLITADYTCTLIPKDQNHVLDITMKIAFALEKPSPVVPLPDYSALPGPQTLIEGDSKLGFYGETPATDLIGAEDLCTEIGLTDGILQFPDTEWLKYSSGGNLLYVAKKTIRHSISWDSINEVGAVFGKRLIEVGGMLYAVRLLSTVEWDNLIYPVHVDFGGWAQYTDADIMVASGNGRATWTSTPSGSSRVLRGYSSVSYSDRITPSRSSSHFGFRPVLEFLYALPSSP